MHAATNLARDGHSSEEEEDENYEDGVDVQTLMQQFQEGLINTELGGLTVNQIVNQANEQIQATNEEAKA